MDYFFWAEAGSFGQDTLRIYPAAAGSQEPRDPPGRPPETGGSDQTIRVSIAVWSPEIRIPVEGPPF